MNQLVDPLKKIARDLVEKKLWPVAALLLVAIVAVPMLIGGSSAPAPDTGPTAGAPAASPAPKSLLTVVDRTAATAPESRAGKIEDPFYDPPEAPAESTAAAEGTPAKSVPAEGAKEGGSVAPVPVEPVPATPVEPVEPAESVYYRTVVRWYKADDRSARPLARLTPLGGRADTAALYLGVTKSSGTYAVFLLGSNATSSGDAACDDGTNCHVIGLKSGQRQQVTVTPDDGGAPRVYTLEVVSAKAVTADADEARSMRAKVHPDGREVMRSMWMDRAIAEVLGPIRYDATSGLLHKSAAAAAKDGSAK